MWVRSITFDIVAFTRLRLTSIRVEGVHVGNFQGLADEVEVVTHIRRHHQQRAFRPIPIKLLVPFLVNFYESSRVDRRSLA